MKEFCRFYNTLRNDVKIQLDINTQQIGFYVELLDESYDIDHYFIEFMLVTSHRYFCWLVGKRIPFIETNFSYDKPDHADFYNSLFPGKRTFSSKKTGFIFDAKYLTLPLIRSLSDAKEFLVNAPADLMVIPACDESYATKIKIILLDMQRKGEGLLDLNRVSNSLVLSPQTLSRKLRAENTSFQQVKDAFRRDLAIDKLMQESLSIEEIAQQLGFIETTSFSRAFKQWTGVSPVVYRTEVSS